MAMRQVLIDSLVKQAVPNEPIIEIVASCGIIPTCSAKDTHLSDLANKIADEYVGEKLVLATTERGDI